MGFAFNSIKEDKGKAIIQTARNYQIESDVTRFVEYYNSKEYQQELREFFERHDLDGERRRYNSEAINSFASSNEKKKYPRKIIIYLDEFYKVYCYGIIFIINQEALDLLTFPFDYVMNNISFLGVDIKKPIMCLPPTLHKLYFEDCTFDGNYILSNLSDCFIDELTISNCIGIDTLRNIKANSTHISSTDINKIIIHHKYSLNLIKVDSRIDQAEEMFIDIDIPYLGEFQIYNKHNFPTRLHCNFHNTALLSATFNQFIICNCNKWTTSKIHDLKFNECIFESLRAFNFNIIDYVVNLTFERCLMNNKYFSSDKLLSLKGKIVLPKHLYSIYVNTRYDDYKDIGYILVRKSHNDYPLRIKYEGENNDNEACCSYWADIEDECQKHKHDFKNTEFSPFISFDEYKELYKENGIFIETARRRKGMWLYRNDGTTAKVLIPTHQGNKLIGEITNSDNLYNDIMSSYSWYFVRVFAKNNGEKEEYNIYKK